MKRATVKNGVFLVLAAAVIFAVLVLPNHPGTMRWSALNRFPLELPVILLGMIAGGWRWGIAMFVSLALVAATFIKLADYGMFTAYNRTFNPILDAFLIQAGIGLLRDSIGMPLTILVVVGAILALILLFFAILRGLRVWGRLAVPPAARAAAAIGALVFGGWAVADAGHHLDYWKLERSPPGTAWTSRLSVKRGVEIRNAAADLAQFRRDAREDSYANDTGLLDGLKDRDVIIIYVESYGRASFDNPLYAPTHTATLAAQLGPLEEAGFAVRSGWLTSPTVGGQSWLAHAALSSGLWTSDHGRYKAMLASGHKNLFHIAQDAGFRTTAVMPAITLAWPESDAMGFDLIFAAADIPYQGERFHWVTMPDQFTLATYADLLSDDPRADFVQIALISSHAPWVPIPDMLPWDDIGDGTEFNAMAMRGPTPRELWKDYDDVRDAYRLAIDYSLRATFEHIAQLGGDAPLVFVVGDHQAAGFVAGSDNRDVPVHAVGPPETVARLNDWGWRIGMIPGGPVRRMDSFRNNFIAAFSGVGIAGAAP